MGHFSMEIITPPGSTLSGNLQYDYQASLSDFLSTRASVVPSET